MKILIFENQVHEAVEAFTSVNVLDFDSKLEFEWIKKSQDFKNWNELNTYNLIFVDIDLSTKSLKDGFGVIDDLINKHNYKNIIVMTGHDVEYKLNELGLNYLKILKKPIILKDLKDLIYTFKN